jgi:glycerophosphoryl diester phosphodiesterase
LRTGVWKEVSGPSAANSLSALVAAVAIGADGVEVDLQLTKDERAVLHHDATVNDEDLLAGCDAGARTPLCELPAASLAHLAELGQALDALAGAAAGAGKRVVCNQEVKALPGEPGSKRAQVLTAQNLLRP